MHLFPDRFMLESMMELDEIWAQKLEDALADAQKAGRTDVAEYLSLKATNDSLRQTAVQWLFGAMLEIAAENPFLKIENETAHRFDFAKAQMVGYLLRFRQGVRCLTLEAGWTRTPNDGFMRNNALAAARISHFGMAKQNVEMILLKNQDVLNWFSIDEHGRKEIFNALHLQAHYKIFIN